MPYLLRTHFTDFLARISVSSDEMETARIRCGLITDLLKERLTVLDAFATGSMARGTGLKSTSDADVMVVLHFGRHVEGKSPKRLLENVRSVLSEYNAQIAKKNGQAITLYFKTWPNVDVVPARRVTTTLGYVLQIPDANTGSWIVTNPGLHDRNMAACSPTKKALIRLVKAWNEAHSSYLLSYHIELIALEVWLNEAEIRQQDDGWPWALQDFFKKALEMTNPTASLSRSYELDDWSALRDRLRRAEGLASDAWWRIRDNDNVEAAVERCRILFGSRFPAYG